MLEVIVVASLALGKPGDAAVIAGLVVFNSIVGTVQHGRAQDPFASCAAACR